LPSVSESRYLLLIESEKNAAMTTQSCERPASRDVVLLLERLRPRIVDLLQRHGCAPETAAGLIREAMIALLYRWSRVRDREQWLLDRIEKAVRRTVNPYSKEPCDDEEPPS
jgi:hypothetical protein